MISKSNTTKGCDLWFPNMFGFKGGIQVYSAFLLQVLQNLYPDRHYRVYLKHDTQSSPDLGHWPQTDFHFTGQIPSSWRTQAFAAQILLGGLWHSPELVMTTHLNFTPVAYWLKRLKGIPYWTIAHGVEAWNIDRPRIENAIQSLDLSAHVTLTGFIPDEELYDHYNLCDVFAMPSKGDGMSSPMALP